MTDDSHSPFIIRKIGPDDEKSAREVFYAALDNVHAGLKNKHQEPDADLLDIVGRYTNQPGHIFLVGLAHGRIIATGALTRVNDRQVKLRRMSVLPGFQGNGYGKAMLARLEQLARELSYTEIILDTASLLTSAIGMYTHAGYDEIQREDVGNGVQLIHFRKRLR